MRTAYLLFLFTTLWLTGAARVNGGIKCNNIKASFEKAKKTEPNVSTGFSSTYAEIELTSISVFAAVHKTVEKKEPLIFSLSGKRTLSNLFDIKHCSDKLLALISVNALRLLFPFHHFW